MSFPRRFVICQYYLLRCPKKFYDEILIGYFFETLEELFFAALDGLAVLAAFDDLASLAGLALLTTLGAKKARAACCRYALENSRARRTESR